VVGEPRRTTVHCQMYRRNPRSRTGWPERAGRGAGFCQAAPTAERRRRSNRARCRQVLALRQRAPKPTGGRRRQRGRETRRVVRVQANWQAVTGMERMRKKKMSDQTSVLKGASMK